MKADSAAGVVARRRANARPCASLLGRRVRRRCRVVQRSTGRKDSVRARPRVMRRRRRRRPKRFLEFGPVLSFLSIASTLKHDNCESFGELHFSALLQGCKETALELPALAIRKPASHVLINQVAFDGLDGLHELLISEGELFYLNL